MLNDTYSVSLTISILIFQIESFVLYIFAYRYINASFINTVIESLTQLPATVLDFLELHQLSKQIHVQNHASFEGIGWQGIENLGSHIDGQKDDCVALSVADCGIAETGSVVFHSGKDNPVLINFLGLYQIVVITKKSIVKTMDDYAFAVDSKSPPRNTIWITGASGTTDIEGVLVQGAHGPCQLHIIVIE